MIEPTDEMYNVFRATVANGDGYREALAAVLAIIDPSPPWATRIRDADDCIWTRVPDAPMVWWHEDQVFGNRTAADIVRTSGPVEWLP